MATEGRQRSTLKDRFRDAEKQRPGITGQAPIKPPVALRRPRNDPANPENSPEWKARQKKIEEAQLRVRGARIRKRGGP